MKSDDYIRLYCRDVNYCFIFCIVTHGSRLMAWSLSLQGVGGEERKDSCRGM